LYSEKPVYADIETLKWARDTRDGLVSEWFAFNVDGMSVTDVKLERNRRLKRYPGYQIITERFQSTTSEWDGLYDSEYLVNIHRPMFAEERKRLENA